MKYLLGIDFGGGSSKATLLAEDGRIAAEASAEYPTLHPGAGGAEQRPEDWIDALCKNVRAVLAKSVVLPGEISAVAVDSATHTSVVCDGAFHPLRPALHWTDGRSAAEAAELRASCGDEIFRKTFHAPGTIWTLPQLLWLKKREGALYARIRRLFFEKDYIRFFLTGEYYTDYIEAAGSMFFDPVKKDWDDGLLSVAGLRRDMLPPVIDPRDEAGRVTPAAAEATGLSADTPVICGTTDTALELFAAGAVEKGDVTVKLATAGRICVVTDRPCPDRDLVNYAHVVPGLWYPGTATKAAAASYRWYRDTFGGAYKELDRAAAGVPIGAEGLFFHPYLSGELTPYADPALCASFTGFRAGHTKAHFSRAVLEGVAFSLMDCLDHLDKLALPRKKSAILIGGGAKSPLWQKILSSALGVSFTVATSGDSSLGSAMLAGVAAGVFADEKEAAARCARSSGTVSPDPADHETYLALWREYRAIHDALAPVYRKRSGPC